MKDVIVIGAGVVGLCTARALLDHGAKVRIIDKGGAAGAHSCSWWAGGMLAPYCEGESAEEVVVRLGESAAQWWKENTDAVTESGSLVLSTKRDRADLKQFARRTSHHKMLSRDELLQLEPDLPTQFQQGLFYETEAHLSPRDALANLIESLKKDGATFEAATVEPEQFDKKTIVIDCRGLSAREVFPDLRGVKGEMLIIEAPDVTLNRTIRMLHPRIPIYIVPRGNGIYMIGATMIESAQGDSASVRSVLELLSATYALNPAFGEAEIIEIGVACRPAFPDNLPRITRDGNIIRVNGLYRHGFLLAPALAEMVANTALENTRSEFYYEYSD